MPLKLKKLSKTVEFQGQQEEEEQEEEVRAALTMLAEDEGDFSQEVSVYPLRTQKLWCCEGYYESDFFVPKLKCPMCGFVVPDFC